MPRHTPIRIDVTNTQGALRAMFDHHIWATLVLIDALEELPPDRLDAEIPGTYGSMVDTLTHLVEADSRYLLRLRTTSIPSAEDRPPRSPADVRTEMQGNAARWAQALDELEAGTLDATIDSKDDYPRVEHAEGLLLLQAIHHGNDHRTQICSTLGALGLHVPELDGWEFWLTVGEPRPT
jgi:uncharacterized damage-inducible protein DinB